MTPLSGSPGNKRPASGGLASLLGLADEYRAPDLDRPDIDHFLYERYTSDRWKWGRRVSYRLKPLIPRPVQIAVRRGLVRIQSKVAFPAWPIEPILVNMAGDCLKSAIRRSDSGVVHRMSYWPDGHRFAFAITHDVEWDAGLRFAPRIEELERELGFCSVWNIIPERYPIDWDIVHRLTSSGCEIGVHGLYHDGKLFDSRSLFSSRVARINDYARRWGAVGFRSPSMLRNAEWMHELEFEYDSSFPDTDPYEPQPGGCCSIWPYPLHHLIELPLTMPQDHTLFEILREQSIARWKTKCDWIAEHAGLVTINVHPDYMAKERRLEKYREFLLYIKQKEGMWHALPREIARWWRDRQSSTLVRNGDGFEVRGPAAGRAKILRVSLEGESLREEVVRG
jgi:hypothetical protein